MRRGGSLVGTLVSLVLLTLARPLAAPLGAQDLSCEPGDIEVRRLSFVGNAAFSDAQLANSIVTTPSSAWRRAHFPFTTRRCLDEDELPRDSLRLVLLYTKHGYYDVRVGLDRIPAGVGAVNLRFAIDEGAPVRIDSLAVLGIPATVDSTRLVRGLDLRPGVPFDKVALQAATDTISARLRNTGYPTADILTAYDLDRVDRTASVEFTVLPGTRARLGEIHVRVDTSGGQEQQIPSDVVRRLSGLRPGELYRQRDLANAQRNLYQLETYRYVEVQPTVDSTAGDSLVTVDLVLVEGTMHTARVGLGWASFDCIRTQAEYVDRNFLHDARRLELAARVSKIGIGYPLDGAEGLCRPLKDDQFSDTLNYYGSVTLRQPTLFGLRTIPAITFFSERRSEFNAYLRQTPIGSVISVTRPLLGSPATYAYQLELGRTQAQPAVLCVIFDRCTSAEQDFLLEYGRLAVLSAAWTRSRTDSPLNPTSGSALHFEVRHSSSAIGSESRFAFNKALADAAWYHPFVGSSVFAARLRVGFVLDADLGARQDFIPPQERLYAGGATTVRGFAQNELGPVVYVVENTTVDSTDPGVKYLEASPGTDVDAVPTGGNSLVVGNLELRTPAPIYGDVAQLTFFTDVGEVWNRTKRGGLDFDQLKWTPGVGLRIFTPFGAFRVDVGYNGYDRLPGAAFYDARRTEGVEEAPLYCVTPGNRWPYDDSTTPPTQTQPTGAVCPATYQPDLDRNFFRRLNFSFSLGQAF